MAPPIHPSPTFRDRASHVGQLLTMLLDELAILDRLDPPGSMPGVPGGRWGEAAEHVERALWTLNPRLEGTRRRERVARRT